MSGQEFTLHLEALDLDDTDLLDSLFEAGCDDGTFGTTGTDPQATFTREAPTLEAAIVSAIRDVESCGLRVTRVDVDELLTISEIAERVGRSRESVRLLIEGKRGKGGFPAPASGPSARRKLWRWEGVLAWFDGEEAAAEARTIARLNAALQLRSLSPGDRQVEELVERLTA